MNRLALALSVCILELPALPLAEEVRRSSAEGAQTASRGLGLLRAKSTVARTAAEPFDWGWTAEESYSAAMGAHPAQGRHADEIHGSDKKFFDGPRADFSTDRRNIGAEPFHHPYPHVQAGDVYDRDFIRDDNRDSGEYRAMMEYDSLRGKIHLFQNKVKEHEARVTKDTEVIANVKAKLDGAEELRERAREDVAKAQRTLKEFERKAELAQKKIDAQQQVVAREKAEFQECLRRRAEAQADLDAAQASFADSERAKELRMHLTNVDAQLHEARERLRRAQRRPEDDLAPTAKSSASSGGLALAVFAPVLTAIFAER